jgi:hypothetical protein
MDYRSTNLRFVHYGGDVTAAIESSHGVQLSGGSTGGIVQAVGDDANISLTVRGKGTGGVVIGNSSQTVTLGSGTGFKGAFSTTLAWTHAAISSGQFGELLIPSSNADIMPGDIVFVDSGVVAPVAQTGVRLSTAATSRVTVVLSVPGSTAASTISGTLRVSWLDLT